MFWHVTKLLRRICRSHAKNATLHCGIGRCLRYQEVHIPRRGTKRRHETRRKMQMKSFIAKVRDEAAKRALYRMTRNEIAMLPRFLAIDLGIFPEDADGIAREAVWG